MKRCKTLTLILLILPIIIISREYIIRQVLPDVGYYEISKQQNGPKIIDLGNHYPKLLIPNPDHGDAYNTNAYSFTGDSFVFDTYIDSLRITGVGDFDNDGLPELLGFSTAYDKKMAVMEQSDTNQIYTIRIWESDSLNYGCVHLGSTDLIKTDGIDRIFGSDPKNSDSGWYYMSSNGDNSYYFDYVLIEDREIATMDIGYLDNDSLVDVIAGTGRGETWWEATNANQDNFVMINDHMDGGVGTHYSGFIGDMDKDGLNEFIIGGLVYLTSPAWWEFNIVEWKSDTACREILQDTITKDYGFKENNYNASDYDIGDIDGDGDDEIIVCAGCILRVYEVMGNDSFVQVWEMDNDTFSGSHVRVHDFNENGIDEIIWSGASDPNLPLTPFPVVSQTYIIENAPISKLDYNNPYILSNVDTGVLYRDSFCLRAIDELPVIIDSLILVNGGEITLNSISYPCSIPAYDSLFFDVDILINDTGYFTDTLIVYSNDWYGDIDTVILYAGAAVELRIDSAVASDNRNTQTGIDGDDYIALYFNYPIFPPDTSVIDLDNILPLSNGHTWYDGTGNIKQINYTQNNTIMTIWLSTNTSIPTVLVGDSIYPDSTSIPDSRYYSYLQEPIALTGTFGPIGIDNKQKTNNETIVITSTFSTISIDNQSNTIQTYQITDISGRMIDNIIVSHGIKRYTPSQSGIYFILSPKDQTIHKAIIIR